MNKRAGNTAKRQRQKKAQGNSLQPVKARAWAVKNNNGDYVLCYWAEPDTKRLLKHGKPSPEAIPMPVWISFRDTMLTPKTD